MLEWVIIIIVIALALAYLALRLARWVGVRKSSAGRVQASRPQGLTVGGKRPR